eukprot:305688_1
MEALCYAPRCKSAVTGYARKLEAEFQWDGTITGVICIVKLIFQFTYGTDVFRTSYEIISYNQCGHLDFGNGCVSTREFACHCPLDTCTFAMGTMVTDGKSYPKSRYEWVIKTSRIRTDEDIYAYARGLQIRVGFKRMNSTLNSLVGKDSGAYMFGYGGKDALPVFHHNDMVAVVADMEMNTAYLFWKGRNTGSITSCGSLGQMMVPLQSERFSLFVTFNQRRDKVDIMSCKIKKNKEEWTKIVIGEKTESWF